MAKLEDILYAEDGAGGFIGNLRDGYYSKALADSSIKALEAFLEEVKKSGLPLEDIRAYGCMLNDLDHLGEMPHWSDDERKEIRQVTEEVIRIISDVCD